MQHTRCLDSLQHEVANGDISFNPTDGDFRLKIGDVEGEGDEVSISSLVPQE